MYLLLQCCKAVVHIDSWDVGSRYPDGHVVGTLGTSRDLEGEMKSLLVEHDISERPFSEAQVRFPEASGLMADTLCTQGKISRLQRLAGKPQITLNQTQVSFQWSSQVCRSYNYVSKWQVGVSWSG